MVFFATEARIFTETIFSAFLCCFGNILSFSSIFFTFPFILMRKIFVLMRCPLLLASLLVFTFSARAQPTQKVLTTKDYTHAEQFLFYNTSPYVDHGNVSPHWLSDDRFWFRDMTADGSRFLLVDPGKNKLSPAFNSKKLAAGISKSTGRNYSASMLPFRDFQYTDDGKSILFHAAGESWKCNLKTYQCTESSKKPSGNKKGYGRTSRNEVVSPNGELAAFIKDDNLWVKNLSSGKETPLTTDGSENLGYATDNASWKVGS